MCLCNLLQQIPSINVVGKGIWGTCCRPGVCMYVPSIVLLKTSVCTYISISGCQILSLSFIYPTILILHQVLHWKHKWYTLYNK